MFYLFRCTKERSENRSAVVSWWLGPSSTPRSQGQQRLECDDAPVTPIRYEAGKIRMNDMVLVGERGPFAL